MDVDVARLVEAAAAWSSSRDLIGGFICRCVLDAVFSIDSR
jgi:hypothetical protein